MSDPRDDAFRLLLDVVRKFNRRPSMAKRDLVEGAARQLVEALDSLSPSQPSQVGEKP